MRIRTAKMTDLDALTAVEAACFPAAEAATREDFLARLSVYPEHFWVLEEEDGAIVSFVNGMVTDEAELRDEMYANASLHNPCGAWQMIFGVNTLPVYRRRGLAEKVLRQVLADARTQGRKGCVLTCKEQLVAYYAKLGFQNEGISSSTHGGVKWYAMRIVF